MANYILKYKKIYRILPELDQETNDFPRNMDGSIDDRDIYISCRNGNKICTYGHTDSKKVVWLSAYIPSLVRGRNIKRYLDENDIIYENYDESDSEIVFRFLSKDIRTIATLLKAKTSGAGISPFSKRNLPKSDVEIPLEKLKEYKEISSRVDRNDLLILSRITNDFLEKKLQKSLRNIDKNFDYKSDMMKLKMSRQSKEYIWTKGFFNEYLKYLENNIASFYGVK